MDLQALTSCTHTALYEDENMPDIWMLIQVSQTVSHLSLCFLVYLLRRQTCVSKEIEFKTV